MISPKEHLKENAHIQNNLDNNFNTVGDVILVLLGCQYEFCASAVF